MTAGIPPEEVGPEEKNCRPFRIGNFRRVSLGDTHKGLTHEFF